MSMIFGKRCENIYSFEPLRKGKGQNVGTGVLDCPFEPLRKGKGQNVGTGVRVEFRSASRRYELATQALWFCYAKVMI